MSIPVQNIPQGVVDAFGVPAVASVSPNQRTLASNFPVGVVGETLVFPGPLTVTGTFVSGSARVFAAGLPVATQVSQTTTLTIFSLPGPPAVVVAADMRVLAV